MALPESEPLHADGAVFLGPDLAGQSEGVLWPLPQMALLVRQPRAGTGVKVRGRLDLCPNPKSSSQALPRHLELLLLFVLTRSKLPSRDIT